MHNILLIDDDEKLGSLLITFFSGFNLHCQHAVTPSQGLNLLQEGNYQLVILDVMLPEKDGFEVCKEIRANNNIPIIMLTARGDVMDRIVGLELGADDYLPKPFEPRELLARVQSILKRASSHEEAKAILVFDKLSINRNTMQVQVDNQAIHLSGMEYQLLEALANKPNKIHSRDDILNKLKGIDADIYSRSVDILISRLRHKLKPLDVIKTIRGQGYIFTAN